MMLSLGKPKNQPLIDYAHDDKEWIAFNHALDNIPQGLDIPLVIGDREVYSDEKLESVSPIDKKVVCTTQKASEEHAKQIAIAALNAKNSWAKLPPENRIHKFRDLEHLLYVRRHEICAATCYECGYTAMEASGGWAEMMDFIRFNPYYYQELQQLKLGDGDGETNSMCLRSLKGFTAAITPFNFPIAIGYNLPTVMALCGNTVVWKPSSDTPLVARLLMQCISDAGFPPGVFNMITGAGSKVMPVIIKHPELTAINFTGSFEVAKNIGSQLYSSQIKRPHFPRLIAETGGKDFLVVDKKADLYDAAACIISGAFGRTGQKCSANSLVLADKVIWADLKAELLAQMKNFKTGDPLKRDTGMGPVINQTSFDKISGFIKRAQENTKCEIFHGGDFDDSQGLYIQPTLIQVNTFPHELLHMEIFGPVVACHIYDDISKAIEVLEYNDYRLTGGICSKDEQWLAKYVPVFAEYAGNFYVNRKITAATVDQQPFGGDGASGTNFKAGGAWYLLPFVSQGTITRRHHRITPNTGVWEWFQANA